MRVLKLHNDDNVSVVLVADSATAAVPRGHKVANRAIAQGEDILKYGQVIGQATRDIEIGGHVHAHNCSVAQAASRLSKSRQPESTVEPLTTTFDGFVRHDGRVGTRNYVGIVSTVSCSATVARKVAEMANSRLMDQFQNIDGFVPITHGSGCGMAGGDNAGLSTLRRTLEGYASHPNFGAVLVIGLGCEVNSVKYYTDRGDEGKDTLIIQESGGTNAAVKEALQILERLADSASRSTR